jgi:hypothetical protein
VAKELSGGDSFGELALLHGAPREANFVAKTPCTLWVLHRDAYRICVMRATEARRTRYKDFLRGVTCLRAMSDYDCLALADASEEVEVPLGETAYTQVSTVCLGSIISGCKCAAYSITHHYHHQHHGLYLRTSSDSPAIFPVILFCVIYIILGRPGSPPTVRHSQG